MSRKSNAAAQENKKLRAALKLSHSLIRRMDSGTDAVRQIALIYGDHRENCPTRVGCNPTTGEVTRMCLCQWDQAKSVLQGVFAQASDKAADASGPAASVEE